MDVAQFIKTLTPAALQAQRDYAIPASFTVAQAAWESGWGRHAPGNNLFGIKADSSWHGLVQELASGEYIHGVEVMQNSAFRAYGSWNESVQDHSKFLKENPRYAQAFQTPMLSGAEFADAIAEAGYATDPSYAARIASTISQHNLAQLDSVVQVPVTVSSTGELT